MNRLLPLFAVILAAAPAFAQNADTIDRETRRPAQTASEQKRAAKTQEAAAKLDADGQPEVTYAQVMADPDNVQLNYRYALTQIRRGDLKAASATLERILLVNPNQSQIRLLYGVVLYRLDNLMEAERELKAALAQNPPEADREEGARYLKEVQKKSKRTQISGRLGAGFEYDDNRNAAPSTGKRLFGDVPIQLTPDSLRRDDTSAIFLGNVEAHHDLGTAAGHEVFGTFNYYRAEQTLVKTLNLSAFSLAGGGVYKTPFFDLTPQVVFDHVELAQTTFLRNHGFDLRLDKRVGRRVSVFAQVHDVMQSYSPTVVVPHSPDRTGIQVDSTLGADYLVSPIFRVGGNLLYTVKHAQARWYSFDRTGFGVNGVTLLGKGTFLLSNFNMNVDKYYQEDATVSVRGRRDTTLSAGATLGAPLGILMPELKDLLFTLTYDWAETDSTLPNYAYTNNKYAAMLTYKWSVGL